ncbi:MAG: DNA topoisomerase I [Marinicella sp.]
MAENLLIVESPAKAKTIEKYLGKGHKVLASYGHVRDLLAKTGAVDPDNDFELKYVDVDKNKKHIEAIVKAAKKADTIYLATDLDREGEAISWHVVEILKERNLLKNKNIKRVVFSEITQSAIKEAVANPRDISTELVDAQQARRALDYLVGFNLSPLLWKKVRRGLSAGRVQSPALRLIVEREDEINAFIKEEYWTIHGSMSKDGDEFESNLNIYDGNKLKKFDLNDQEKADRALAKLKNQAGTELTVTELIQKQRKRKPSPPFITSTLQQEASRKLGFTARKTMQVAQQLYEGLEVNGQSQGLITYMRTDSLNLANDAIEDIRSVIKNKYGSNQVPETPNFYKSKSKNAQEAHEAIRAVSAQLIPVEIKKSLNNDQFRLYDLIWKRTLASQMINATIGTVTADFTFGDDHNLRATGSTILEKGFLTVYEEGLDDGKTDNKEKHLPNLKKGDVVDLIDIKGLQHFTEPPPRYSEATLVKALEEFGIGRPSTYASIISTLLNRDYVELENKRFIPTDVGKVVARFLETHFNNYVDYEFTARLEDALDAVSRGEKAWKPLMKSFWEPFSKLIEEKEETVSRDEAQYKRDLGFDPDTGTPVSVRIGKYGTFVQIGTKEDEEKPKFAGLLPGQKLDTITFDEAMALFALPRELGETSEGEKVTANIGRFGPYVRYGNKFVSIKKDQGDPYSISLEEALVLIKEKKIADANRIIQTFDDGVQVLNGRWGPYVTDGNKNGKIAKDQDPKVLTHEQCLAILAEAPEKKKRTKKKIAKKKVTKKKTTKKKVSKKKTSKKKTAKQ